MRRSLIVAAVIVAVSIGCTSEPKQVEPPLKPVASKRVDWQGNIIGERGKAAVSPDMFTQRVMTLLHDGRRWSATSYVERYPDVAAIALRTPPVGIPADSLAFIGQVHDRQTGGEGGPRWEDRRMAAAILAGASPDPGEGDKTLRLCKATEGTSAAVDGYRLAAQIYLAMDRAKEATSAMKAALSAAVGLPYETIELWLLYAESLRRSGQMEQAEAAWAKAAIAAAMLLNRSPGVKDPLLWERLASLRQVQAKWPTEVHAALLRATQIAGFPTAQDVSDEGMLWIVVGCWRLDRNESNAAVTSFKRAETLANDQNARALLQVWQSKSLVMIDQVPTATALLTPLADHPNPAVASAALATLGAIRLQAGAVRQARGLFERADSLAGSWQWRADVKANLALAMFLDGEEQQALDQLHQAQDAFRETNDLSGLLLACKNELEYWTTKGESSRAKEVRKRIERIEATGTAS